MLHHEWIADSYWPQERLQAGQPRIAHTLIPQNATKSDAEASELVPPAIGWYWAADPHPSISLAAYQEYSSRAASI